MRKVLILVVVALVVVLLGIQFIPVEMNNPPVEDEISPPEEVKAVLRRACYNCHSNETIWPWYGRVAPISWTFRYYVHEGRDEVNFSTWGRLDPKRQIKMKKEISEETEEREMPPWLYRLVEPGSRLSDSDRSLLRKWVFSQDLKKLNTYSDDHDDDNHESGGKRKRYQKRYRNDSKDSGKRSLTPVNNQTYKEECAGCHFAYQPELLPSGSWDKILAVLEDHSGEVVELDPDSKKIIAEYLKANAADHSSAKRAVKIMRSLGNRTPLRITDTPYIREKHHEVPVNVLDRDSISSLSNCVACHTKAEMGIYDDDYVVIPQ